MVIQVFVTAPALKLHGVQVNLAIVIVCTQAHVEASHVLLRTTKL